MSKEIDATVAIVDGRVAMSADGDATLYVEGRDRPPLSSSETHLTLRVEGDDYRAELDLDGDQLDGLVEDLTDIQEGYRDAT